MTKSLLHTSYEAILLKERDRLFSQSNANEWLQKLEQLGEHGIHKRSTLVLMVALAATHKWLHDANRVERYRVLVKLSKRKLPTPVAKRVLTERKQISNNGVSAFETRLWLGYTKKNYRGWISYPDFRELEPLLALVTRGARTPSDSSDFETRFHRMRLRAYRLSRKTGYQPHIRQGELEFTRIPYLIFYMEQADHIDVWRVLHAERDIPAWIQAPQG